MTTVSAIEFGRPAVRRQSLWRYWRGGLRGSEFTWALAFLVPYIAVFLAFVVYPVFYGLWMGSEPSLYTEVFSDPIYQQTVVNTMVFVAFGVNLKLFLALMLSGFFMRPGWWVKGLLMIFVLPWAVPALPTFISIHWMLNGEWGLLNNALYILFGVDGPSWLNSRWLALGSAVCSHVWKWMPFWTVILLAGRMSIPQEIYDAAKVDGATGLRRFSPRHFSAARQPLSGADPARDDLFARRLQHGLLSSPAAGRPTRRICWRRSASATPSTSPTRSSASRRSCRRCRC